MKSKLTIFIFTLLLWNCKGKTATTEETAQGEDYLPDTESAEAANENTATAFDFSGVYAGRGEGFDAFHVTRQNGKPTAVRYSLNGGSYQECQIVKEAPSQEVAEYSVAEHSLSVRLQGKTHELILVKESNEGLPLLYVQWQGERVQYPLMQIADAKSDVGRGDVFTHYDWAAGLANRRWVLLDDATGKPSAAKVSVKKEAMELVTLDFTITNGGKKTNYHCEVYNDFTISCKPEGDTKFSMTPTVMPYQLATWSIVFDTNEGQRLFTLVQDSPIF